MFRKVQMARGEDAMQADALLDGSEYALLFKNSQFR